MRGTGRTLAALAVAVAVLAGSTSPGGAAADHPAACRRVRVRVGTTRRYRTVVRCTRGRTPAPTTTVPGPKGSPPPAPLVQAYLTRDGGDAFSYLPTATGVVVVGDARNVSSNTRVLLWDPRQPQSADAQSCVSFTDTGVPAQEGVALRVRQSGSSVRSVTVTKNVMFGATTLFNVHTWDTSRTGDPWRLAGQIDFGRTLRPGSFPWRLCARGEGPDVKVKVWELGAPEPDWTDTSRARSVTVGPDWSGAGATGFYVGHLGAGRWARLDDLATAAVVVPAPTTTVPTPSTSTSTTSTSITVP